MTLHLEQTLFSRRNVKSPICSIHINSIETTFQPPSIKTSEQIKIRPILE